MRTNLAIIALLVIATFVQFFLKIAYNTTLLSYIVIVLVLAPRIMFSIKLFGLPASIKMMYAMEAIGMALPSLFSFSRYTTANAISIGARMRFAY